MKLLIKLSLGKLFNMQIWYSMILTCKSDNVLWFKLKLVIMVKVIQSWLYQVNTNQNCLVTDMPISIHLLHLKGSIWLKRDQFPINNHYNIQYLSITITKFNSSNRFTGSCVKKCAFPGVFFWHIVFQHTVFHNSPSCKGQQAHHECQRLHVRFIKGRLTWYGFSRWRLRLS